MTTTPPGDSSAGIKRKRLEDDLGKSPHQPAPPPASAAAAPTASASGAVVNYSTKLNSERLQLIEGDADTFSSVLEMIDEYEGVLNRHESLASNLGARLTTPVIFKSFEKLFLECPFKVIESSPELENLSWLDIVKSARSDPGDFILSEAGPGPRSCRIWIKNGQIEITEDAYILIMFGSPESIIPSQPIPEDEATEIATLGIVEQRLVTLIKKADTVASKARQLNYHLKGRKSAALARRPIEQVSSYEPSSRSYSPQPFSAINARSTQQPDSAIMKLQTHLLEQFLALDREQQLLANQRTSLPQARLKGKLAADDPSNYVDRRQPQPTAAQKRDAVSESRSRLLMANRTDKLERGDKIWPPCDRCRRLDYDCAKYLTACSACTKKHAKCTWRDIQEGELDQAHTFSTPAHAKNEETDISFPNMNVGPNLNGHSSPLVVSEAVNVVRRIQSPMSGGEKEQTRSLSPEVEALAMIAKAVAVAEH